MTPDEERIRRLEDLEQELADVRQELYAANEELRQIGRSRLGRAAAAYRNLRRFFSPRTAPPVATPGPARRKPGTPAAPAGRHDVVCFPIIDWHFRFQRPQQLLSRFAAAGHRVFYLSPRFRASGPSFEVRAIGERIFEVSLRGRERDIYSERLDDGGRDELLRGLEELRNARSLGETISFVQLPFWYPLAAAARDRLGWPLVYDCLDNHAAFATSRPEALEDERRLRAEADLVVASSAILESEARKHNGNVLLLRNACDYEHFAGTAAERASSPVVGYYGAIAEWFDTGLVADLARRRPDWRFVLVGSTFGADLGPLARLGNVEFPGEVPYGQVPKWLARFDVAILPFRRTPLTEATNPVKAYEILAAGKPLVSVPLPEVERLAPLVRLASTAEEFESAIGEELSRNDWGAARDRRRFAAENTWAARFEALAPAMRKLLDGGARIAAGNRPAR